MLDLHHPFTHVPDLREHFLLLLMQTHNRLEPTRVAPRMFGSLLPLFFELLQARLNVGQRLLHGQSSIVERSEALDVVSAPSTIAAYSSNTSSCALSCSF